MSATISQDTQAPTGAIDRAFSVASDALDVWAKWTTTKTENTVTKAGIESQVIKDNARTATNGAPAMNSQTLLIAGAAVILGVLLFRGK